MSLLIKGCVFECFATNVSIDAFFLLFAPIILVLIGFLAYTNCVFLTGRQDFGTKRLRLMYMHGMQALKEAMTTPSKMTQRTRTFRHSRQEVQKMQYLLALTRTTIIFKYCQLAH